MIFSLAGLMAHAEELNNGLITGGPRVSKIKSYSLFPGFFDVHVHFREPGFSYKETIYSGSMAGAHGGYTGVCTMPNLRPVPDSLENLKTEQDIIDKDAVIDVLPYASITVGEKGQELVDIEALAPHVFAFSDDGVGVQDEDMMREAMLRAKAAGKFIVAHCEVNSLLKGGYIHDGGYAAAHGHKGISSASEYVEVERDIRLAGETGASFHACHISTKESVEFIRQGKANGFDVSGETGPHYLVMDDSMLEEDGRFRMNPPIRGKDDRDALIAGILDGTIECIATDHAPHSAEEKAGGLAGSNFGVVGLETSFPVLYTKLVKEGVITLDKLIDLMALNPRRRFNIEWNPGDFTVYDLDDEYTVDPADFLSMGKASPFEGWNVCGRCLLTVHNGKVVYKDPSVEITD